MRRHFFILQPVPARRLPVWSLSPQKLLLPDASPVQATRDVAASLTATQPVEAPTMMMRVANQPVEAPVEKVATQPGPSSKCQICGLLLAHRTSSEEVRPIDQSLTSKKTVPAAATGVLAHI